MASEGVPAPDGRVAPRRLWLAPVVVAMAVASGLIGSLRRLEPRLLGRENPDLATSVLHTMVATAAWTAMILTLAQLLLATVLGPQRSPDDPRRRVGRAAWRCS
ncbi:MAG: cytochrome c oxidase assembly protein, partial [Acidipropionibacterium jensenii]|nr:cytochrome c oxidase assembly protein [Acidipropionibacterium jensenii]